MRGLIFLSQLLLCMTVLLSTAGPTRASGVISYGGDVIIRQFYDMAWEVLERADAFDPEILPWLRLSDRLHEIIPELRVEVSEEEVFWNGQSVLMLNLPEEKPPRIIIAKKKWVEARKNSADWLQRTMVHELFLSVGILDVDYGESRLFNTLHEFRVQQKSTSAIQFYILNRRPWYIDWWNRNASYLYRYDPYDAEFLPNLARHVDEIREANLSNWVAIVNDFFRTYSGYGLCADENTRRNIDALDGFRPMRRTIYKTAHSKYQIYCAFP